MDKILIVDDDPQLRKSFVRVLENENYEVVNASSAEEGIRALRESEFDLAVLDLRLPGMNGIEGFEIIKKIAPKMPVIIMTAYGTTENAIEATKMGAFDYILKPFEIPDMLALIQKGIEAGKFMRQKVEMGGENQEEAPESEIIIGRSAPMQDIYKSIGRVAPTEATILIRGESGTGKELVARAIYQHSSRSEKSFQVINCVAIPETLLESELFGYEKGAFTGAQTQKIGKIEQADKGTVFLDEIGDMPLPIQAKILRLLQEKSIERLGGGKDIAVNVRIIAATNRDLERALEEGSFREDLYYRLKVVTLHLPPLRERPGDISLLADHALSKHAREMDVKKPDITPEALKELENHSWPGNVRELFNVIQKALIFSRGCPISAEDMQRAIHSPGEDVQEENGDLPLWAQRKIFRPDQENLLADLTDEFQARVISRVLDHHNGNRTKAARQLGISRPTLISKIEKLRL